MPENRDGPFWAEIGQMISDSLGGGVDRVLIYIGCERACVADVAYREQEHDVEQISLPYEIVPMILEHWEALDPATRWADVAYSISNGRFHVEFVYPDHPPAEGESLLDGFDQRAAAAFAHHFDGKPMRLLTDDDWNRSIGKTL